LLKNSNYELKVFKWNLSERNTIFNIEMIENFGLTIEIRQNPVSCVTNFYKKRLKTIIIGNGHFFLQGITVDPPLPTSV